MMLFVLPKMDSVACVKYLFDVSMLWTMILWNEYAG